MSKRTKTIRLVVGDADVTIRMRPELKRRALSREEVARLLDESPEGRIKGILATMVSRRVLAVTGDGYQLNLDVAQVGQVRELLGRLEGVEQPPERKRGAPAPQEQEEVSDAELARRIEAARREKANGTQFTNGTH